MIDESIAKNVDYNIMIEEEKKARLDNDISLNASKCVEIVSIVLIMFNFLIFNYILLKR